MDEQILDMATDSNNNTYYLVPMYQNTPLLAGQSITNYGGKNIVLFSTDCQGNIRWSRAIGSATTSAFSQKIVLDNNGGLYLTFFGTNPATTGQPDLPLRFDDNNAMPYRNPDPFLAEPAKRNSFLLKYNTANGNLVWRRDLQGDVSIQNNNCDIGTPLIDSQSTIHLICGFKFGTHLNGLITVPSSFDSSTPNFQYYLVKYDTSGNIVGNPSLLPITGSTTFQGGYLNFMYDETNSRYYLAGSKNYPGNSGLNFSYNGTAIIQNAFVLAFNSTNFAESWRKEINNGTAGSPSDYIFGLKKDPTTSDLYISGRFFKGGNNPTLASFGTYSFTTPLIGQISFAMKLSNSGNVIWCNNLTALSDGSSDAFIVNARMPLAINGNELLFAKGSIQEVWGNYAMTRPANDRTDPLLVRFNKDTGVVNGTYEVQGSYGQEDHFTAVAVDNDNNIMLGGFINSQLFTATNDNVATISNAAGSSKSDFFFAKLATSATCSSLSVEETAVEAGLQFYPNPVQDFLTIKSKNKLESYEVYSSAGQTVLRGSWGNTNAQINMSALTAGVYYVKVKTEKAVVTEKVIKK
jgi:hypothetical protein